MKTRTNTFRAIIWVAIPIFVTLSLILMISWPALAQGGQTLAGRWNRLNPGIPPEHETLNCGGSQTWHCRYDKQPEPTLGYIQPPDVTYGFFLGQETTSSWTCPTWFPAEICTNAAFVVEGVMDFHMPDGSVMPIDEELIVTESEGSQVLYVYWVDQHVCPWFRSFEDAQAANPDPSQMDCVFAP